MRHFGAFQISSKFPSLHLFPSLCPSALSGLADIWHSGVDFGRCSSPWDAPSSAHCPSLMFARAVPRMTISHQPGPCRLCCTRLCPCPWVLHSPSPLVPGLGELRLQRASYRHRTLGMGLKTSVWSEDGNMLSAFACLPGGPLFSFPAICLLLGFSTFDSE